MTRLRLGKTGAEIRLGQELGSGGEGSVFAIADRSDVVAKIYASKPDERKIQKLSAMTGIASPALLRVSAWPVDVLQDVRGVTYGFIMPRVIARRDIHELYSPKSRAEAFPDADFRFLCHVGANIARAFAVVHEHGHVLGDINHGNLLVGPDGTVILIDCDSIQLRVGTQVYTSDVGVPLFTPSELHGQPLKGLVRTPNHDRFGLAILLFHLLYMGRHPFAGRYSGPGEMPIDKAIAEYRFAYGPERVRGGMESPPGTPLLEAMGAAIASNFIRAFSRSSIPSGRPDAQSWIRALDDLKAGLRTCSAVSWHQYPAELGSCLWCSVEKQTAVRLFRGRVSALGVVGAISIEALWRAIIAVADPGPDPLLPSDRPFELPSSVALPSAAVNAIRKAASLACVVGGLIGFTYFSGGGGLLSAIMALVIAASLWPRVSQEQRSEAERAYAATDAAWQSILGKWIAEASQGAFQEKLKSLEKARVELLDLPSERSRRLRKLDAQRESQQRQRYLDRFRIEHSRIRGIGASRTSMLESYGIETAADISPGSILRIPGFGESLTSALVAWRREHESNFRYNPNEAIHPQVIFVLDQQLEARRQQLMAILSRGPADLRQLTLEINAARPRLMPVIERTWTEYRIAQVRRDALR